MLNHRKAYTVALLNARAPKQGWDTVNLLATDFFFQILAHPVFKM